MKRICLLAVTAACSMHFLMLKAVAETTECTEITALPAEIVVEGVYCFKSNLATSISSGNAISVSVNNVTIDFNGFKLGGIGGGPSSTAVGINVGANVQNTLIRNASVRGFYVGFSTSGTASTVEDSAFESATKSAIFLQGSNHVVRRNKISKVGPAVGTLEIAAISADGLSDTVIEDNILTQFGLFSPFGARPFGMANSNRVVLRRNTAMNFGSATNNAIAIVFSSASSGNIVEGNRIVPNPDSSPTVQGIYFAAGSTNNSCLDNVVVGYGLLSFNCELNIRNHLVAN